MQDRRTVYVEVTFDEGDAVYVRRVLRHRGCLMREG
jgi:hypothetical protein